MFEEALERVKEESIEMHPGMKIMHSLCNRSSGINMTWTRAFSGTRALSICDNVISFIDDGRWYAHPFTSNVECILYAFNFKPKELPIPFINGDYPLDIKERAKWDTICEKAKEERRKNLVLDAIGFSNENSIQELSEDTLQNCIEFSDDLKFTKNGKNFRNMLTKVTRYKDFGLIGNYNCDYYTGIVIVIYRDLKNLVFKSLDVLQELEAKNYRQNYGLYVPFSEGEQIQNEFYAARWRHYCNKQN